MSNMGNENEDETNLVEAQFTDTVVVFVMRILPCGTVVWKKIEIHNWCKPWMILNYIAKLFNVSTRTVALFWARRDCEDVQLTDADYTNLFKVGSYTSMVLKPMETCTMCSEYFARNGATIFEDALSSV